MLMMWISSTVQFPPGEEHGYRRCNVDAIVDLAYAFEMKGELEKAILQTNRLLDIDPYSYDAWSNIGKLYSMNGQYDKAIDAFDFALTIVEDDLQVLKMKALSLYLNDNAREAIAIFQQCLQRTPNDQSLYDSLFEAYEVMEQYDEMMKLIDLKESIFGSKGILSQTAFVHLNREEIDKARELFEQIPEDKGRRSIITCWRGTGGSTMTIINMLKQPT